MFELMAGRLPFVGATSMDVLLAHATEPPPRFADLGLGEWVPPAVEEVVRMCLAKDPTHRPQSARELGTRFAEALGLRKPRYTAKPAEPPDGLKPVTAPSITLPLGLQPESDVVPLTATEKPSVAVALLPPPAATKAVPATVARPVTTAQSLVATPAPTARETPVPANLPPKDPTALPFQMDAWMPETIAIMKLRGFVNDYGGEVLSSSGGVVYMRLGRSKNHSGAFTWLGINRRGGPVDVALHFIRPDPKKENQHTIHVLFKPPHPSLLNDKGWRERCTSLFVDLRAYLMGG
jgi:serine/threonine-protein kinase